MSTTDTTDTTDLDNAKNQNSSPPNYMKFLSSTGSSLIVVILYFCVGAAVLYTCKLAQSNILPTNIDCAPYTNNELSISEQIINIFVTTLPGKEEPLSAKLEFIFEGNNTKNTIIDMLTKLKYDKKSSFMGQYFVDIIQHLIQLNYATINMSFNMLNGAASESFILLLGPIIAFFVWFFLLIVDCIYLIYLWFYCMSWFFKHRNEDTHEWEGLTTMTQKAIAVILVIIFACSFWGVLTVLPIIPGITIIWCFLSCIGYESLMFNVNGNGKPTNIGSIMQLAFRYNKKVIMAVVGLIIANSAFTNLNTTAGVGILVALLLIMFNVLPIDMFKQDIPQVLSKIVSYEQVVKGCKPIKTGIEKVKKNSSWFFGLF